MKRIKAMKRVLALVALMLLFAPVAGQAACTLAQPPTMDLGIYTGTQSNSGITDMTVTCTQGSNNYTIGISGGSSGNTANRTMKSGSVTLNYALFRDSARTQNWGNVAGTDTYAGSGSTANVSIPVYPRIAAGQTVPPGTYTDSVSTGSRTFTVTATVQATCTLSATPLAFGNYISGSNSDSTSTLSMTCTNTTPYSIGLDAGQSSGATVNTRGMTGPAAAILNYHLYQDSARSTGWNNTSYTVAGTGTGGQQTLTVYGRILSGQHVQPGSYSDIIIVTLTY